MMASPLVTENGSFCLERKAPRSRARHARLRRRSHCGLGSGRKRRSASKGGLKRVARAKLNIGERDFPGLEVSKDCFLRDVILVGDASAALQDAPGFTAFDREKDHLAGDGIETDFTFN